MLEFVFTNETGDAAQGEEFFKRVIEHGLSHLKMSGKKVELGLHIITPERSQELNREHRNKDKPTDVLSFPLSEGKPQETYGILTLGDIFICLEVAQRQAEESHIPLTEELARLSVHGLLHLAGYDHETSEADEKEMTELEDTILASIKD